MNIIQTHNNFSTNNYVTANPLTPPNVDEEVNDSEKPVIRFFSDAFLPQYCYENDYLPLNTILEYSRLNKSTRERLGKSQFWQLTIARTLIYNRILNCFLSNRKFRPVLDCIRFLAQKLDKPSLHLAGRLIKTTAKKPDDRDSFHSTIVVGLSRQKEFSEVLSYLEKASKEDAYIPKAHTYTAIAVNSATRKFQIDIEFAIQIIEWLKTQPSYYPSTVSIGEALCDITKVMAGRGNFKGAVKVANAFKDSSSSFNDAIYNIAQIQARQKDQCAFEKALSILSNCNDSTHIEFKKICIEMNASVNLSLEEFGELFSKIKTSYPSLVSVMIKLRAERDDPNAIDSALELTKSEKKSDRGYGDIALTQAAKGTHEDILKALSIAHLQDAGYGLNQVLCKLAVMRYKSKPNELDEALAVANEIVGDSHLIEQAYDEIALWFVGNGGSIENGKEIVKKSRHGDLDRFLCSIAIWKAKTSLTDGLVLARSIRDPFYATNALCQIAHLLTFNSIPVIKAPLKVISEYYVWINPDLQPMAELSLP